MQPKPMTQGGDNDMWHANAKDIYFMVQGDNMCSDFHVMHIHYLMWCLVMLGCGYMALLHIVNNNTHVMKLSGCFLTLIFLMLK